MDTILELSSVVHELWMGIVLPIAIPTAVVILLVDIRNAVVAQTEYLKSDEVINEIGN